MRNVWLVAALIVLSAGLVAATWFYRQGRPAEVPKALTGTIGIVTTTGMVAELARNVGGDRVAVTPLMGAGVDPHLYKASEGDVRRMNEANIIFYSGLHLEGKMTEVFEQMSLRGIPVWAVTSSLDESWLLSGDHSGGTHDPHVWFNVALWAEASKVVEQGLAKLDPEGEAIYRANGEAYRSLLMKLHEEIKLEMAAIPPEQRVLVTAHDAFSYFGHAYGIEVRGVQGMATTAEAGTSDIQTLARFIAKRRIPALFVESSVPPQVIQAVKGAVNAHGWDVVIGGELYSDAMGPSGSGADTYIGMVQANVRTIVDALSATHTSETH